jgi:hypothetical protein
MILKWMFHKARECELDSSGTGPKPVERFRDYGNELTGSVKVWEFLYRLSDCQLLSQGSALGPSRCSGGLYDLVSLVRRRQLWTFSLSPYISAALSVQYSRTFRIGLTLKGLCFAQLHD